MYVYTAVFSSVTVVSYQFILNPKVHTVYTYTCIAHKNLNRSYDNHVIRNNILLIIVIIAIIVLAELRRAIGIGMRRTEG